MSTLWTPGGERPIRREPEPTETRTDPAGGPGSGGPAGPGAPVGAGGPGGAGGAPGQPTEAEIAELRDQLARTPAELVIANHAYGLFELAALHLSVQPPQLEQARLAIDALSCLVEGLGERLGAQTGELNDGLGQLRMAFVQIQAAAQTQP